MSTATASSKPIDRVLNLLESVREVANGWTALCPAHDDNRPSLSIAEGENGKVLLKCFGGCKLEEIVAAIGLEMADLFPRPKAKQVGPGNGSGLTLEEYARAKRLPIDFLQKLGVGEIYLQGRAAVRIPYMDRAGGVLAARMRVSMTDDARFVWKTGSKPFLYGLWRLQKITAKYVCLNEHRCKRNGSQKPVSPRTLACDRHCEAHTLACLRCCRATTDVHHSAIILTVPYLPLLVSIWLTFGTLAEGTPPQQPCPSSENQNS